MAYYGFSFSLFINIVLLVSASVAEMPQKRKKT